MGQLHTSKEESKVLGLRIARSTNIELLKSSDLVKEIFENKFDLCRMKISLSDPTIFDVLNKLCIPYNIFSFLIRKKVTILGNINYKIPELVIVKYDKTRKNDFETILENVLHNSSAVNFTNFLYNSIVDRDLMIEASINYYINLAENDNKSNFFLGYINNDCVGFCSFRLEDEISEGIYFGISNQYRNLGLAHEFLTYAKEQSFILGAKEFWTDTIIQNPKSLYPQINIGLVPNQTYLNVVFFPLLTRSPEHKKYATLNSFSALILEVNLWIDTLNLKNFEIEEIKFNQYNFINRFVELEFRLHIISADLFVLNIINLEEKLWFYFTGKINK